MKGCNGLRAGMHRIRGRPPTASSNVSWRLVQGDRPCLVPCYYQRQLAFWNTKRAPVQLFSTTSADSPLGQSPNDDHKSQVDLAGFSPETQQFLGKVEEFLFKTSFQQSRSTEEPTILVLGVSGGCDSMGLAHAMLDISTPQSDKGVRRFRDGRVCELHVVHFDHQQRGRESDLDCKLVQDFCQDQNIPCHTYTWPDRDASNFSQDRARQWRQSTLMELLEKLTTKPNHGLILTAHHANDSQETLLLKLLRGAHVRNLSGMASLQSIGDTLWARPLLELTKHQIQTYLESNGYVWREDASNQSNKYLRNRVRNELMPLMQELVGGEAALAKRLSHLEEQCRDVRNDLSRRVEPLLKARVDENNRFLWSSSSGEESTALDDWYVNQQALYEWATAAARGHAFSYDVWSKVLAQLQNYPNNRQWTLPLGEGWFIVRRGDALQVVFENENDDLQEQSIVWSYVDAWNDTTSSGLMVEPPAAAPIDNSLLEFVLVQAGDDVNAWKFTPPWREGRSPLKLGSFLRGQKVPLHKRGNTPMVFCRQNSSSLVAVRVEGKWIIDAAWTPKEKENGSTGMVVLHLS